MGRSYRDLTNRLAERLADGIERDDQPWTKPYTVTGWRSPHNPVTNRVYTGFNWYWLAAAASVYGYGHGGWATYRQWQGANCQVRRGERGTLVIRVQRVRCCRDSSCQDGSVCGGDSRYYPVGYNVFSRCQVDGTPPEMVGFEVPPPADYDHAELAALFRRLDANWHYAGARIPRYTRYADGTERIITPWPEQCEDLATWGSIIAHEFAHWTAPRLGRVSDGTRTAYAREELVAELAAVTVCTALGIEHVPHQRHARYLRDWLAVLRSTDGGASLLDATKDASAAARYLLDGIGGGDACLAA